MTSYFESKSWPALGAMVCALTFGLGLVNNVSGAEAPGVAVRATDPTTLTGSSTGAFTIIRHGDPTVPLTVNLSISGTAVSGVDYTGIPTIVSLDPGVLAYDIVVQGQQNLNNPSNKTVIVTLQTNAGYQVYGKGTATVKIVDDLFDVPPPSVTLTGLVDGSIFTAGEAVTLTADTSDSEIAIQSVSFYANDTFLGSVTNAPYTFVWNTAKAGKFAVFARAVDASGKSGVSSAVDITVSAGPVVTISSYFGDNVWTYVDDTLTAEIGDPNEPISSVTFYDGTQVLGTVTSAPFSIDWTPTKAGYHNIKAVAVDANTGKSTTTKLQIYAGNGSTS